MISKFGDTRRFLRALPFVLQWEGGYVNDPDDPGGVTNKGVTQGTYDAWRISCGHHKQPVRFISDSEVRLIYKTRYWDESHCGELADGLDLAVFDTAVNMGNRRAVRFLQKTAGCTVDGIWGPVTRAASSKLTRSDAKLYLDFREQKYEKLILVNPRLAKFRNGWLNRLNSLRRRINNGYIRGTYGVGMV